MSTTWLISDTHFGHNAIIDFKQPDGTPLRPFTTIEEMDQALVDNWNKTVKPKDKVYHLGDVVIHRKALKILQLLNGDKVLIRGNHDIFKLNDYTPYFRDIRAFHKLNNWILSHVPLHPESLNNHINIHGHLHCTHVKLNGDRDIRYHNICVEHTNYTPISIEDLALRIK